MQYLYKDGDSFHFMDTSSYEQLHIPTEALGESVNFIIPDAHHHGRVLRFRAGGDRAAADGRSEGQDTVPGIKGATASAQVKPATLETGLVVQVPPFVNHRRRDPGQYGDGRVSLASMTRVLGSRVLRFEPEDSKIT